ncbi:Protein transport protein Sec61 subunit gamma [Diplonema papillatum]|nr:Protein transport protein Sec61 subunit gamma [Diplonema papillatum]
MADMIRQELITPLAEFYTGSKYFLMKCQKPTFEEFSKVGFSTAAGFVLIGFIGFIVKLIFIPINNVVIGQ